MSDLVERVAVLRDEVLDTSGAGSSDGCHEVFAAMLAALTLGKDSTRGIDTAVHDALTRRMAWGDSEAQLLRDIERVFDRLMIAVERAFRDFTEQMVVIEAATRVAMMFARGIAVHAVARVARDRITRVREEMAQLQLREAVESQTRRLAGHRDQESGGKHRSSDEHARRTW
jgi:hypothetical protein